MGCGLTGRWGTGRLAVFGQGASHSSPSDTGQPQVKTEATLQACGTHEWACKLIPDPRDRAECVREVYRDERGRAQASSGTSAASSPLLFFTISTN
eukprot:3532644-Rhodomonas_salina.2